MSDVLEYRAVIGGLFFHAADPWTGRVVRHPYPYEGETRFKTMCGRRLVIAEVYAFDSKPNKCAVCVKAIADRERDMERKSA
jgi:hypothetical protein